MSQVNLLPLESIQSPNNKGATNDFSSSSASEGKSFSEVINRHYNPQESGNKADYTNNTKAKNVSHDEATSKNTDNRDETNQLKDAVKLKENEGDSSAYSKSTDSKQVLTEENVVAKKVEDTDSIVDAESSENNDETNQFLSLLSAANQLLSESEKSAADSSKPVKQDNTEKASPVTFAQLIKGDLESKLVTSSENRTENSAESNTEESAIAENAKLSKESAKDSHVSKNIAQDLLNNSKAQSTSIITETITEDKNSANESTAKDGSGNKNTENSSDKTITSQHAADSLLKEKESQGKKVIGEGEVMPEKIQKLEINQQRSINVEAKSNASDNKVSISDTKLAINTEANQQNKVEMSSDIALHDDLALTEEIVNQDVALDSTKKTTTTENDKLPTQRKNDSANILASEIAKNSNNETIADEVQAQVATNEAFENKHDKTLANNDVSQGQKRVINQATATVVSQNVNMSNDPNIEQSSNSNEQSLASDETNVELDKMASENLNDEQLPLVNKKGKNNSDINTMHNISDSRLSGVNNQRETSEQVVEHLLNKVSSDSLLVNANKPLTAQQFETIAIHRKDFVDSMKDKVMVMINQKLQQVEIRLDPAELGHMHVKVNLQNEQAAVSFIVQNQQAKDALDQNMGKLREMLAESGVDVGDANIEQQKQQTANAEDSEQQKQSGQNTVSNEQLEANVDLSQVNLYKASSTGVDYYA